MPRKRSDEVLVDPVAAARQLPSGGVFFDPAQVPTDLKEPAVEAGQSPGGQAQCALGHQNTPGASFCSACGLNMSAPAPAARVDLDAARPRPASQLTTEERAERDRQHADALRTAAVFEAQQPDFVPPEGETVLIHFIEDGLTFAGQVWYRGQEIEIGPSHPRWEQARGWILLDRTGQIERYGKQYFAPGPWPGRRSYLDGINDYQRLSAGKDADGNPVTFAGPGEQALRQADEMERRRGRAVPGMVIRLAVSRSVPRAQTLRGNAVRHRLLSPGTGDERGAAALLALAVSAHREPGAEPQAVPLDSQRSIREQGRLQP